MSKLKELQKNFQQRMVNLKYNYATELLDNISNETYSEVLDSNKDLFSPISGADADDYLHKPEILDAIVQVLENALDQQAQLDQERQCILSKLEILNNEALQDIESFIDEKLM